MSDDQRVKEYSVDKSSKRIVFRVFNAYFYEFTELANGVVKNTNRWKEGAEGRAPASHIWIPPDIFAHMVRVAHGIAKDRFKPDPIPEPADELDAILLEEGLSKMPAGNVPRGPVSDAELDQLLFCEEAFAESKKADPRPESDPPGYPCADFIPNPADSSPKGSRPRKEPYRRFVGRRGSTPQQRIFF